MSCPQNIKSNDFYFFSEFIMNWILFSFVLATTAITLAISSSATCTYTCNSDGSCEHKTDFSRGGWKRGTCIDPIPPNYCLDGICCKGQTEECGKCLDKCDGKVGKLVIEGGQVKSNGRTNIQQKPRNNPQITQQNSPIRTTGGGNF